MSEPTIRVENVSKRFRRRRSADSLRDVLSRPFWRRTARDAALDGALWAVRDVSFELHAGDRLGLIGANGAGKSTLLRLMAGILRPDAGRLDVRGPVSALIELSAGFHPDLTGRENVYLNGSVLGMSQAEVRGKFDRIVAFSGVEEALDAPVKHYSSGMTARLAFAVAAHVDAAVLLIDEALSVGDVDFRARCLALMDEAARAGVTTVFVSHDLDSVRRFCKRAIVLSSGAAIFDGPVNEAVARYYRECSESLRLRTESGEPPVLLWGPHIRNADGDPCAAVRPGELVRFGFSVEYRIALPQPSIGFYVVRQPDQLPMYECSSTRLGVAAPPARPGDRHDIEIEFPACLPPGEYALGLHVRDRDALKYGFDQLDVTRLRVTGDEMPGSAAFLDATLAVEPISHPAPSRSIARRDAAAAEVGA